MVEAAKHSPEEHVRFVNEYWRPIFLYIRSRLRHIPEEDVKDLTQDFFTRFIQKDHFQHLDRSNGRVRTFLSVSIRNFLHERWKERRAQKRGGGIPILSLEGEALQVADEGFTPDKEFDRQWAIDFVQCAFEDFGEIQLQRDAQRWLLLKELLPGKQSTLSNKEVAELLGVKETNDVTSAVTKLRKKFANFLRAEVRKSLGEACQVEEIEDELEYLLQLFGP